VPGAPELTTIPLVAGWLLVILIGAEVIRITAERRAERLAVQEAEQANRIIEERLRIARELHDVVAHNISLINVQAGAALHLIDTRPEQAKPALAAIKQASKDALVELRSILGVLRQVDEPGPRQPTPGLVRLEELVERARQPDLDVELRIEGTQRPLPSAVDVAAYRIVQEAVTNVLRHARASRVEILVTYTDSAVVLDVVDDGQGFATSTTGARSGLVGMRERVTALDGEFEAGPRPGGGFAVHAEIPAAPVDSTDGSAAENGKGTSAEKGSEENR
ncbi:MAG TPA: sensor histidine kinase, partial [Actinopolymorphaceae bacterium]